MLQSRSKIENCADKWKDGWCCQVDFTEKLYHKKYECYLDNLQEWGEHTKGRYILAQMQAFYWASSVEKNLPTTCKFTHEDFNTACM
ncbi:hypothetical protein JB92DRAFT_3012343 [Gautieria morchelliformis]|nr:hypothetical protein JB92DRAFT_3012343 [Gautieria morchelliformis]